MKIGIPRAIGYHYYSSLWNDFLSQLGFTVIESEHTNRNTLQQGCLNSPSEACLPLKCFMGHVLNLIPKTDALFIPRLVCLQKHPCILLGCPKYIALPDMIKASFPDLKLISPCIDCRKTKIRNAFSYPMQHLGFSRKKASNAFDSALQKKGSKASVFPFLKSEGQLTIGLLGHAYLVNDPLLNLNIINRLKKLGCRVLDFSAHGSSGTIKSKRKPVSWYFEEDILLSAEKLLSSSHIDGIVYLLSFGCGAGSITSEIVQFELDNPKSIPLLKIVIDEHTAEAGLDTRLESYIDMLSMRKEVK